MGNRKREYPVKIRINRTLQNIEMLIETEDIRSLIPFDPPETEGGAIHKSWNKKSVEIVTEGTLHYDKPGGNIIISYEEIEPAGLETTHTSIILSKKNQGCITMLKYGHVNSQIIFENGLRHYIMGEPPLGGATMCVSTKSVDNCMDENGGGLNIDYAVDFSGAGREQNSFNIDVKRI